MEFHSLVKVVGEERKEYVVLDRALWLVRTVLPLTLSPAENCATIFWKRSCFDVDGVSRAPSLPPPPSHTRPFGLCQEEETIRELSQPPLTLHIRS